MRDECYQCHIKTVSRLIEKFRPAEDVSELLLQATHKLLNRNNTPNPLLATNIHRLAKNLINRSNLYKDEKATTNNIVLTNYSMWRKLIDDSRVPFHAAAKLAVASNVIDYGAHSVSDDIEKQILELYQNNFAIDETYELFKEIGKAKKVLYLGDNAGEIVFDKMFIETMQHPGVTFVVRGKPVINDVTFEDVKQTGIDEVCKVISNGYDAPSTLLEFCSEEFLDEFDNADLIISKGQGNFEGLMHIKRNNLFFLLMAKCEPMAELLAINKGDMVITKRNTSRYAL